MFFHSICIPLLLSLPNHAVLDLGEKAARFLQDASAAVGFGVSVCWVLGCFEVCLFCWFFGGGGFRRFWGCLVFCFCFLSVWTPYSDGVRAN